MAEITGELPPPAPDADLAARYDYLAALLAQIHRHAAEGLASINNPNGALEIILEESVLPCPARVSVVRGKDVLIAALRQQA